MATLDFPDAPAIGDEHGSAGVVWVWDGAQWIIKAEEDTSVPPRLAPGTQQGGITVLDWNGALESGWYDGEPGSANAPAGEEGVWLTGMVYTHRNTNNADNQYLTQIVWRMTDTTEAARQKTWMRQCHNGIWTPWSLKAGGSGFTFLQDDAPVAEKAGDTWYQTSTGDSYVWTFDGTSHQWVQFAPGSGGGGGGGGGGGSSAIQVGNPIGAIFAFSGDVIPADALICDGQAVPAGAEYDALRAIVGANVPDLRDKFLLGASATKVIRTTGGAETHTLSVAEIPSHNHPVEGPDYHPWGVVYGGATGATTFAFAPTYVNSAVSFGNLRAKETGGSAAHNNMPPWYAVVYVIQARATMALVAAGTGGGGGSGFTFVQDTAPTPTAEGDTWFDTSTAASGGTSWVAVDEGGGSFVWVQFAPGTAAGVQPYYCNLYGITGSPQIPVNTGMAVPWTTERYRRGLTHTGGAIYCPDVAAAGLYAVTATVEWWPANSWPPFASPGFYQVWISVNRARTIAHQTGNWDQSTGNTVANCAGQVMLAAGDYVEAWVRAEPTAHGPYIFNAGEFAVARIGLA